MALTLLRRFRTAVRAVLVVLRLQFWCWIRAWQRISSATIARSAQERQQQLIEYTVFLANAPHRLAVHISNEESDSEHSNWDPLFELSEGNHDIEFGFIPNEEPDPDIDP